MSNNVETIIDSFESALLDLLLEKLKTYHKGDFLIEDLFNTEWKRIPETTRKTLGKRFARYIEQHPELNVEFLKKDSANKQHYEKK